LDLYSNNIIDVFHYPIDVNFDLNENTLYFTKDEQGYIRLEEGSKISSPKALFNESDILDLTGEEKVVIQINQHVFGFLFQEIPEALLFYSRIKNRKIKAYINIVDPIASSDSSLSNFFIKYLTDLKIDFEIISDKNFKELKINNFYVLRGHMDPFYIKLVYAKVKKYLANIDQKPFRKAFIARRKNFQQRIDSDEKLKEFFVSAGFEIVYAEDFNDLIEQINYFNECKVVAGISGSGLSNCIFMKPGGTLVEISSFFDINDNGVDVEIHHFYKIMADAKNHLYFSISNLLRKEKNILNNKKALDILRLL
jgi:hypothetical protein